MRKMGRVDNKLANSNDGIYEDAFCRLDFMLDSHLP